jgi:hypothetical protein
VATGIPVNYRDNKLVNAVRVLGAIALIGGLAMAALGGRGELSWALAILAAGAAVLIGNEIVAAMTRPGDRSVVDTGTGFRWIEGSTDVSVEDQQVVALRLKRTSKYASGILKAVVRQFEVWTEGREKPFCMCNRLPVGSADPLAALIGRIIDGLKQRTAAGLAAGAALEGEGWRLAAMNLTVRQGKQYRDLSFGQIDHAAMFDDKLCIWMQGENEPAAKIDPDSKNAPVLGSLLSEWLEHQKAEAKETDIASAPRSGLGRLLFERRTNDVLVLAVIVGLVGVVGGAVLSFQHNSQVVGVLVLAAGCVFIVLGLLFGRYVFRCHELGLTRRRGRSETRMSYGDVVEFNYGATRMFHNGVYTGTSFSLSFRSPTATIRYSVQSAKPDNDMENLRDHVSRTIAQRMFGEIRAGAAVPWGNDVVFLPAGLQVRRSTMLGLGSAAPEVLPYSQIRGTNMEKGVFFLFSKGAAKPFFSKPVASPNFFPGYYLLLTLINITQQSAQST